MSHSLFAAIEAGGTKTVCAIASSPHEILQHAVFPTSTPDETLSQVLAFFSAGQDALGPLAALGVASFGPIEIKPDSPNLGTIVNTPKPGWTGFNYLQALSGCGVPIRVDTDVNGAGLGEWIAGNGKGIETLCYVTVGTGIGAGVLKGGVPLSGFMHYEIGHIRPPHDRDKDPFPGRCPYHGNCLEGLASGPAIIDRWGAPLNTLPDPAEAIALEAEYLAYLVYTIVLCHMPDRIVLGGGVMKAAGLIEQIRIKAKALLGRYIDHPAVSGDLSDYIVPPALGDDAGIVGAIALAEMAMQPRKI